MMILIHPDQVQVLSYVYVCGDDYDTHYTYTILQPIHYTILQVQVPVVSPTYQIVLELYKLIVMQVC